MLNLIWLCQWAAFARDACIMITNDRRSCSCAVSSCKVTIFRYRLKNEEVSQVMRGASLLLQGLSARANHRAEHMPTPTL